MKMAHIAYGSGTYEKRAVLKQAGYTYHQAGRAWYKLWNMDGGTRAVDHEREWLTKLGLPHTDVDYDAVRPGNETWLMDELVKANKERSLPFEEWIKAWDLSYRFSKGEKLAVRVTVWSESEPSGCAWAEGSSEQEAKANCVKKWGSLPKE